MSKRIIFMGNPVPEGMVSASAAHNVNIADNIAQNTMIGGLSERYGENLSVISVSILGQASEIDLGKGVFARAIKSNNLNRPLYYLSLIVNYTRTLLSILKENKDDTETIVITNGPYIYMALPVLIAKMRHTVKWVPFLVGSVEIPEARFPYNLISKLSIWTSRKADGVITYVAKSAVDYMPDTPFVEIVYLIDSELMKIYKAKHDNKPDKFTITYTGALSNIYNINVITKVIRATGDRYKWVFAGLGQNEDIIKKLSNDSRYDVEYLGAVSNIKSIYLQKSSNLLLCLRGGDHSRVNRYYSKYAASGKLIEYLCSGVPILAGDIPGFSEKIKPYMTCEKVQNPENIIKDIENIVENYGDKMQLAKDGQVYSFKYFTAEYQNNKIYDFLETL